MGTHVVRWIVSTSVVLGLAVAGHAQAPQHEHQQTPGTPSADMSVRCKAMMAQHASMMAEMRAADQRLDELVARMNQASGQAKVDAMASLVTELVAQRKTMHGPMVQMHQQMMSHVGEHMQEGAHSMAMCPMMKVGGMQH